ncbi:hypothetical protein [Leptolyngbya sp. 7M]|uniref:hypothetical protein n=1 Tax=Leptolyngbya sp. 7M TaxID=2812896 RepID=UPI001B8C8204|nr:hypothetical protein [Leptolyngbya sp. 7M]QYO63870.1 hypothetical protein JVX88_29315 [Leptolyngbya sp. 7M]
MRFGKPLAVWCDFAIEAVYSAEADDGGLGSHSYSYLLTHNLGIGPTISLIIGSNLMLWGVGLPIRALGILIFSVPADYTTPLIQRIVLAVLPGLDDVLTTSPKRQVRTWHLNVGDRVRYCGEMVRQI